MPKRIPVETVTVLRDGKRVTPKIGQPFEFTTKEVTEIVGTADAPGLRPQALRRVSVEQAEDLEVEEARRGPSAQGEPGAEPGDKKPVNEVGKPAAGARKGKPVAADDDGDL